MEEIGNKIAKSKGIPITADITYLDLVNSITSFLIIAQTLCQFIVPPPHDFLWEHSQFQLALNKYVPELDIHV